MHRSTDRILTTHVGSLIRPAALQDIMRAKQGGQAYDQAAYETCLAQSIADVVGRQAEIGVDVVSDGEFGKAISWAQYPLFRLGGFERRRRLEARRPTRRQLDHRKAPALDAQPVHRPVWSGRQALR